MAFGRGNRGAEAGEAHHRSVRRKVFGYLIILVAVFVGVMLAMTFLSETKITVR